MHSQAKVQSFTHTARGGVQLGGGGGGEAHLPTCHAAQAGLCGGCLGPACMAEP